MKESILPRMKTATQDTVLGGIIKHLNDKKMVIVLGEPGEGKTITVLDFCVQNTYPSHYYRCSPNTQMSSLLIFMAKAIGVRITDDNDQLQELIQEKLRKDPNYCFAFDEVEYLACGNCHKLDVLRQIYDETDVSIIICGTYELKDMLSGEQKRGRNRSKTHNRSQLFRRLRKAEFGLIEEKEVYDYLSMLEDEYAVVFDPKVKANLVSQCRDRNNGGLGNFVEIIELIFSELRPEWQDISYQIIERTGRALHNHTEPVQSFTGLKPTLRKSKNTLFDEEEADYEHPVARETKRPFVDVNKLKKVSINLATYNDILQHKMGK